MRQAAMVMLVVGCAGAPASAQTGLRVVAAVGSDGPLGPNLGTPERFYGFDLGPQIMDDGTVVFAASAIVGNQVRSGVWVRGGAMNTPIAAVGMTATGMPDVASWTGVEPRVTVRANAASVIGEVSGRYRFAVWRWSGGSMEVLVRHRMPVPGAAGVFISNPSMVELDASGVAWGGSETDGVGGNLAMVGRFEPGREMVVLQRTSFEAPGLPEGNRVIGAALHVSPEGRVMAGMALSLPDQSLSVLVERQGAVWTERYRVGGQAPGCPAGVTTRQVLRMWTLNGAGYAFLARLEGPGVNSGNDRALFIDRGGGLALSARTGDPLPEFQSGALLSGLDDVDVAPTGRVAATVDALLRAPAGLIRGGVLIDDPTHGRRIVLRQDSAGLPGIGNRYIRGTPGFCLGPNGHLAVQVLLDGPGAGPDDQGVWVLNPDDTFRYVMRTGDVLDVPGRGATTAQEFVLLRSGDETGTYRAPVTQGINAWGDLAMMVRTDPVGQVVVVSPACAADFNADGFVDFFDYQAFVACLTGEGCGGRSADLDGDGVADSFDYQKFVAAFEVGC